MASQSNHIVVIGAGVSGLQTAVSLLKAGYGVTIVAKHFPGDLSIEYTSPWAGAHWHTHASNDDVTQKQWDIETYKYWIEALKEEQKDPSKPRSGLKLFDSLWLSADASKPWFAEDVLAFKTTGTQRVGNQTLHVHTFQTIGINSPAYLAYLLNTAISLGATTLRATLPRSSTLSGTLRSTADLIKLNGRQTPIAAFVNATGISAKFLVPDDNVYPIRGHTVTVKGEATELRVVANPQPTTPGVSPDVTYILTRPGSGTTIIGGTKQENNWTAEPNPQTTKEILERAKQYAPELLNEKGEFEVISTQIGLRPGRKGGARVEVEEVRQPGDVGEKVVVCHAYGHAGGGYQNSIGSASTVVRLLNEYFAKKETQGSKL